MNILFVCKFNRFRSKVAEAMARHYLNIKGVEIRSAGIMTDFIRPFVAEKVVKIMQYKGMPIVDEKSQLINENIIQWADKIIIVADNFPLDIFPKDKVEIWPVVDASEHDEESVLNSVNEIEKYTKDFAERLNTNF